MDTCYELETFTVKLAVSESLATAARSSYDAVEILRPVYADLDADQEHFALLLLDNKNKVRAFKIISSGSQTSSVVHPAIVFRNTLLFGACAIIVAHNHPSGDPSPSTEDIELTRRLKSCAEIFGIRLLDHVVLGAGRYFSFSDRGILEGGPMPRLDQPPPLAPVKHKGRRGARGPYNHSAAFMAKQAKKHPEVGA
jgi:DNA repair protein RadC